MSDITDSKEKTQDEAVESRRNFLKQASVAGLGVGTVSVGGLAGLAVSSGDVEAAEGGSYGSPVADPSRENLGGVPIYDRQGAFDQPILKPLKNRVLALEKLLVDKKIISQQTMDIAVQYYSEQVGPYIGKAIVARAWVDSSFKNALLNPENEYAPEWKPEGYPASQRGPFSATLYMKDYLDYAAGKGQLTFKWPPQGGLLGTTLGPEGEFVRVVANGKEPTTGKVIHNLVACTLCSCYPQALLGVQPEWYKSRQYRARSVSAPRGVLLEFAESNGNQAQVEAYLRRVDEVRVWDSNSEVRFLVIPEAPAGVPLVPGTETQLVNLITRDGMIGSQVI
jgi:nitrile hydratase subunit alpha